MTLNFKTRARARMTRSGIISAMIACVFLNCNRDSGKSHVDEAAAENDRTKILLLPATGAEAGMVIATETGIAATGVCPMEASSTETCTSKHAAFLNAPRLNSTAQRNFFKIPKALAINANLNYHVIDAGTESLLRRVRISERPVPPPGAGVELIQEEVMRQELTHLASDEFNGRLSATPENERAAQFIIEKLQALGIGPARAGNYLQSFTLSVGPTSGKTTSNIVALIPGTDPTLKDEYVVIGAHMDHAGTLQKGYTCSAGGGDDKICNGADDNGSGTIAVLNVAKALASTRENLKRSVVLMWFSGEEEGLLGSNYYVNKDPIVPLKSTMYMINLDMVGNMKLNGNRLGALGGKTLPVAEKFMTEISAKYPERKLSITPRAGGGSDHVPFMAKGIPGVFFHTGLFGTYHKTSDSPDKIDYAGMQMAARVAFELVQRVANEPELKKGLTLVGEEREPLVTEEEMKQTCHHLMENQFLQEAALDFRFGNDGKIP